MGIYWKEGVGREWRGGPLVVNEGIWTDFKGITHRGLEAMQVQLNIIHVLVTSVDK